ncbi:lysylphosphatidylglycerol synthase domain-containing protein [Sporolactobacillus pectinivorans]|uniref:lysylphosphatidylglycerol synthase domain-containing protein n=1 Tax=Sporolactobacillus pectinivorans TaxID=1591408 RepID=UPI000C255F6D|nr:lysylphosphatidylglycerol synthase domain-containing protein [Sporolactobacillus pectinivorans]
MSTKIKIKLLLGIIITIIVVYYSFKTLRGLNLDTLLNSNINWFLVIVSVIINIYANYVRSLGYTLGIDPNINRMNALQIVVIGHAANMILPLHIGDGLRFAFFPSDYHALRRTKLVMIPAFADFIAMIMISLFAVPFSGFKDHRLVSALWILFFLCIALIILLLAILYFVPRFRSYFNEFLNIHLLKMMLWVTFSYVLLLLATWVGLAACGFGIGASFRMSLAVFAATNLVGLVPSSPGAIGLFEDGVIIGLAGLGILQSEALTAGLLLHLIQYAALVPLGIILFIVALRGDYKEAIKNMLRQKS